MLIAGVGDEDLLARTHRAHILRSKVYGRLADVHSADTIVARIDHNEPASGVDRNTVHLIQFCCGRRAVVTGEAGNAISSNCPDRPALVDAPDAIVIQVGDIDVCGSIDPNRCRMVKLCLRSRATVTAEAIGSVACEGGNDTVCIYLPNYVASIVCDIEVARKINGQSIGA